MVRGPLRHWPEELFHDAGGVVNCDEGVAVLAALFLEGHDKTIVIGFKLRAFAALAAPTGAIGAAFSLRRGVTAVRPEVEDGMQVGRQVVGELERAVDEGGFDGILTELFMCDMKLFMWMFDEKTCGSVRSSLSAHM